MMRKSKQSGFTLVEIAIVLVIVGLLLGGVLKGQELITNAQVKNYKSLVDSVTAAHISYTDRYKALPGDHSTAQDRLVTSTGVAIAGVVNGNGNGIIGTTTNTNWAATTAALRGVENIQFFAHMYAAQMLSGSPNGATAADLRPKGPKGELLAVGYIRQLPFAACFVNTNGRMAELVDSAFDDGRPGSGNWTVDGTLNANNSTYREFSANYASTNYTLCSPV